NKFLEKYDQFISQEEIRLAEIKQQAIILSGEINELCHLFRDHLGKGQFKFKYKLKSSVLIFKINLA
ncbi:unnamed protein product, partial [Rotaria sp. Silwood1]